MTTHYWRPHCSSWCPTQRSWLQRLPKWQVYDKDLALTLPCIPTTARLAEHAEPGLVLPLVLFAFPSHWSFLPCPGKGEGHLPTWRGGACLPPCWRGGGGCIYLPTWPEGTGLPTCLPGWRRGREVRWLMAYSHTWSPLPGTGPCT